MNFQSIPTTVNICVSMIKPKYFPRLAVCWPNLHILFSDWFFPVFLPSSQFFLLLSQQTSMEERALVLNHGIKSAQQPCFKMEHPGHSVTSFSFFCVFYFIEYYRSQNVWCWFCKIIAWVIYLGVVPGGLSFLQIYEMSGKTAATGSAAGWEKHDHEK